MATITLFKNVPWSQGGFHVLRFPSLQAQETYFSNLESTTKTANYDPRPGADLKLDIPLMEARQYNYLSWEDENNGPLYYFIEDYEYLNDYPTTRFTISEDIWQNNHLRINGIYGAVHRRHMPRWDGNIPLLYPVDEGNVRSKVVHEKVRIDDSLLLTPFKNTFCYLIAVSKIPVIGDGIHYYLTAGYGTGGSVPAPGGKTWLNPLNDEFISRLSKLGIAPSDIIGVWLVPVIRNLARWSNSSLDIPGVKLANENFQLSVYTESSFFEQTVDVDLTPYMPVKNSAADVPASPSYEPQVFSENIVSFSVTDTMGNQLITIPNNLLWQSPKIIMEPELASLNPQIRISVTANGAPINGLESVAPCIPVAVPQSQWLDYIVKSQQQDKSILENNISNRYMTNAISTITGGGSGYAFGAMYADSFNNSRRSPGMAGLAGAGMNAISGIGSLVNAYIQSGTDRDNFRLNEQKIKNAASPPLAGYNIKGVFKEGINFVTTIGDNISTNLIWKQYLAHGVIIDEGGLNINLRSRRYYDYIQTRDCTVSGTMNNISKSYLESLLNRGVTIWHAEAGNMYNYNYDNIEVA